MQKFICILSVLTLLLSSLTGCGSFKKSKSTDNKDSNPQTTTQPDYVVSLDSSFKTDVELEAARVTLSPEEADFRNLKWGMSKDEVINAEGTGFREPKENVMYYTRVREEGFPADAEYTFVDEKLASATFYILQNKEDKSITFEDYTSLVASFITRFDQPTISDTVFFKEEYKTNDVSQYVDLVKAGNLNLRTGWILDGIELRVVMFPKNGEACIGIQYIDPTADLSK